MGRGCPRPNGGGGCQKIFGFFCLDMVHFACILTRLDSSKNFRRRQTNNFSISFYTVISITVSVSFLRDHFYMYIVSLSVLKNLFSTSFSMSFTDINHFSISLSFSYWNITHCVYCNLRLHAHTLVDRWRYCQFIIRYYNI